MKKLYLLLILGACTSSQHEKLNQQGIEMHGAALVLGNEIDRKIGLLSNDSKIASDSIFQDSLRSIIQEYQAWESSIIEVPGHEHDHHNHEGHDHNHDHSASPDLTPEMVLEIQTELKRRAEKLNEKVDRIIELFKSQEE